MKYLLDTGILLRLVHPTDPQHQDVIDGHRQGRSQGVGRFGLDGNEEAFFRARQQPVNQPLIGADFTAQKSIVPAIDAFDVEFLTRLDTVLPPQFGWKRDLAFARHAGLHVSKIFVLPAP